MKRFNDLRERQVLVKVRIHTKNLGDLLFISLLTHFSSSITIINELKPQLLDPLEALIQMILNSQWVLGLAQDVQQIIIRQKEKAGERKSLRVQIIVQTLLNTID